MLIMAHKFKIQADSTSIKVVSIVSSTRNRKQKNWQEWLSVISGSANQNFLIPFNFDFIYIKMSLSKLSKNLYSALINDTVSNMKY